MKSRDRRKLMEFLFLAVLLWATNLSGLGLGGRSDPRRFAYGEAAVEVALALIALWMMWDLRLLRKFGQMCLSSWPLLLFLGIAAASMGWTVAPSPTLARVMVLICGSLIAAYLAMRYNLQDLLDTAARFFVALVAVSALVALAWPSTGIEHLPPYTGSWSGIFWHRNYLGSTMALGALVLLLAAIQAFPRSRLWTLSYGFSYVAAIGLVVLSRSVTGLILVLILHGFVGVLLAWLRLHSRLRRGHYWAVGVAVALLLAVAFEQLDFLLGLFDRSTTFTGRVGLWEYLYSNVFVRRPILGHGFGALWSLPSFQLTVRDALGWPYSVFIGDNGFVDIALHLGITGLAAFVFALGWAVVRVVQLLIRRMTILSATPLLVIVYMLGTNVTLSYFVETETFTWLLVFAFVFSAVLDRST